MKKKKNSMLACRMVCCSHRSDRRIWVCILHLSDCRIRVCISHRSDYHIRVCISHQSYHSIWISCTDHSVQGMYLAPIVSQLSCKLFHGIKWLCTQNDIDHKFWPYFDKCNGLWPSRERRRDLSGYERFEFNFFVSFLPFARGKE